MYHSHWCIRRGNMRAWHDRPIGSYALSSLNHCCFTHCGPRGQSEASMAQTEAYHAIVSALPHRLRVMRMYRYGLRELLNYSSSRHEWYPRAAALRTEFESTKSLVSHSFCRKFLRSLPGASLNNHCVPCYLCRLIARKSGVR